MTIPNSVPVGNGGAYANAKPYVGSGGAWHAVQNAWVGNGGSWRQFFQAYVAVSVSGPGLVTGSGEIGFPGFCSGSAGATAAGANGTGSYSYAWSRVSAPSGMSASGAGTATLTLTASDTLGGAGTESFDETWQCVVSDGVTSATLTTEFNITLTCDND